MGTNTNSRVRKYTRGSCTPDADARGGEGEEA